MERQSSFVIRRQWPLRNSPLVRLLSYSFPTQRTACVYSPSLFYSLFFLPLFTFPNFSSPFLVAGLCIVDSLMNGRARLHTLSERE